MPSFSDAFALPERGDTGGKLMEYDKYLSSKQWKSLKKQVYKKYKGKCHICKKRYDLDTHHQTYKRIYHEKLTDLVLLCHTCHYRVHRQQKGIRYLRPSDFFIILMNRLKW